MHDSFLDTSWTLHYHPINNAQSYRKVFSSSVSADQLNTYSERLTTYLTAQASQHKDDFDDEDEKLGAFKECRWTAVPRPSSSSTNGKKSILINLIYQKQTYKIMLYSAYMTLTKASSTHTRRIFDFLTETFGISLDLLKLSPDFLQGVLADYISTLTEHTNDDGDNLNRLSILKTAVSNLKLTIAFSGPVAPNLKSIDLDIPHDTVDSLLSKSVSQEALSSPLSPNTAELDTGSKFLARLMHYITEQTGLKLPLLTPEEITNSSDSSAAPAPAKLSRVTTSFWVFSVEGKIKFSARVIDANSGFEDVIRGAGADILIALDQEARRRNAGSGSE